MPKTKLQDLAFSILMVVSMVYCMTAYNIALNEGFSWITLWDALRLMWPETVVAFFAQRYIAKRVADRILHQLVDVETVRPLLKSVCIAAGNVFVMAPLMTLLVNLYHNGVSAQLIIIWLSRLVYNFPFALCIQVFFVGPFVRLIFQLWMKATGKEATIAG